MKKLIFLFSLLATGLTASAQGVGLSFSYFVPRHGSFSTPISPFSIRGVGVNLNRFLALQTGASLYRMSGLNMVGLPFDTNEALVGPNFTLFVPVELVLQFKGKKVQFDLKGGGFGFYGFDQHLNEGNLDRAIRKAKGWYVVNTDLSLKNHPGYGWLAGAEFTFRVTRQFSISLETNYLNGLSKLPLKGSYAGGKIGGIISSEQVEYRDAKVDFTGLEFSVGVTFSGR